MGFPEVGRWGVMGILNVTPDSFSDGGLYGDAETAIRRGLAMREEGAILVDVGGESTRPGSERVAEEEELRRVLPVVEGLVREGVAVSIDTMKARVAEAALAAGAVMVNDVTGLRDAEMLRVCGSAGATVCVMHMQGEPKTMQMEPQYGDVVAEVRDYLVAQAERAVAAGCGAVWIDPGIGFGKSLGHNLSLLRGVGAMVETGYPVLMGVSRKSFLGRLGAGETADGRLAGSLAAAVDSFGRGARLFRVHDVRETVEALRVAAAIRGD